MGGLCASPAGRGGSQVSFRDLKHNARRKMLSEKQKGKTEKEKKKKKKNRREEKEGKGGKKMMIKMKEKKAGSKKC